MFVAGLWYSACSASEAPSSAHTADASAGQGGIAVVDSSFGGFASTGGAAGSATGGNSSGGATSDAAVADSPIEAPFVCDSSGSLDCSAASTTNYSCGDPAPNLGNKVKTAVQTVLAQQPSWFDFSVGAACCPLALQPQAFRDAVVAAINASGACASVDPNNPKIELVVKTNNKCSEQWVILTSGNIVRNPPKHQGSCVPAWL